MNPEESHEQLYRQVNEVFQDSFGTTKKGRIQMAAYALSEQVAHLDILIQNRDTTAESIESADKDHPFLNSLKYSTPYVFPPSSEPNTTQQPSDVDRLAALFNEDEEDKYDELREAKREVLSPIEKAKLAVQATEDGVRAVYNLTPRQVRKAIKLSRRKL